jgi:protein SCO1/2
VDLVSISVDPQRDTPAVLQEYAARYGADPRVWHFLTGPEATLQGLLQTGFKVGSVVKAETDGNLVHSSYFLLVDRQGKVRALYDGTEVDAAKMFTDLHQLSS